MAQIVEIEKSQQGRLWTILVFCPMLLIVASLKQMTPVARAILIVTGIMIILTAGYAFIKTNSALRNG